MFQLIKSHGGHPGILIAFKSITTSLVPLEVNTRYRHAESFSGPSTTRGTYTYQVGWHGMQNLYQVILEFGPFWIVTPLWDHLKNVCFKFGEKIKMQLLTDVGDTYRQNYWWQECATCKYFIASMTPHRQIHRHLPGKDRCCTSNTCTSQWRLWLYTACFVFWNVVQM